MDPLVRRWVSDGRIVTGATVTGRLCRKIDGRRPYDLSLRLGRPKAIEAGADIPRGVRVMSAVGRRLLPSLIVIIGALTGGPARAQGILDQDKSGAKLFAANCADCHRSPRGLYAQDRFSWTLSYFLREHYTSSPASAQALTAYLQSAADAARAEAAACRRLSLLGDQYCMASVLIGGGEQCCRVCECRALAAEKIAQAECEPENRKRLLTAAEAWLVLADQMDQREPRMSGTCRARSRKRAASQVAASPS